MCRRPSRVFLAGEAVLAERTNWFAGEWAPGREPLVGEVMQVTMLPVRGALGRAEEHLRECRNRILAIGGCRY